MRVLGTVPGLSRDCPGISFYDAHAHAHAEPEENPFEHSINTDNVDH